MGKNKRQQIKCLDEFHGVELDCDSKEECDFICWCSEAAQFKIIQDYEYQPQSIMLSEQVSYQDFKNRTRMLFREHIYSPDFIIRMAPGHFEALDKQFKIPYDKMNLESFQIYLDIKGTFQRNDGGRAFSINQKWVFQKTGIYVQKLVPKQFFQVCGCPQRCFMTAKTNKPRKPYLGYKSIKETFAL